MTLLRTCLFCVYIETYRYKPPTPVPVPGPRSKVASIMPKNGSKTCDLTCETCHVRKVSSGQLYPVTFESLKKCLRDHFMSQPCKKEEKKTAEKEQ